MTKEQLEERIKDLTAEKVRNDLQGVFLTGQIKDCQHWIEVLNGQVSGTSSENN